MNKLSPDLSAFIAYFANIAAADADVHFFCYGNIEQGIDYARGHADFAYPFVWLEQPIITTADDDYGNMTEVFNCGLLILETAPLDQHPAQILASAKTLQILRRFQKELKHDTKKGLFVCNLNTTKKEAISSLWIDSHYGWRLEFTMSINANQYLC